MRAGGPGREPVGSSREIARGTIGAGVRRAAPCLVAWQLPGGRVVGAEDGGGGLRMPLRALPGAVWHLPRGLGRPRRRAHRIRARRAWGACGATRLRVRGMFCGGLTGSKQSRQAGARKDASKARVRSCTHRRMQARTRVDVQGGGPCVVGQLAQRGSHPQPTRGADWPPGEAWASRIWAGRATCMCQLWWHRARSRAAQAQAGSCRCCCVQVGHLPR